MTAGIDAEALVNQCLAVAADVLKLPMKPVWLDYDDEADVLYMSFRRPQRATRTIEMDDGILIRKSGKSIVGLTILNAISRQRTKSR
ncbi:MAG: DUF2283 domain-containing protein [Candidatus Sumerlaeota bacterium]|nr:DUF2283 domain-containing protein [Candidatus Sumerlaeota bacterium]